MSLQKTHMYTHNKKLNRKHNYIYDTKVNSLYWIPAWTDVSTKFKYLQTSTDLGIMNFPLVNNQIQAMLGPKPVFKLQGGEL